MYISIHNRSGYVNRFLFSLICFSSLLLVACDGVEDVNKNDANNESNNDNVEATNESEENPILKHINDRALEYGAKVEDVRVNEDANNPGEYLILIDFKKLGKKDKDKLYEELAMYSDDIAATLGELKEINTVVAFWELPNEKQGDNSLKRAYIKKDDSKMYLDNEFKDVDVFGR